MTATKGFSLLEVLLAVFVFGLAVLAFTALQASSLRGVRQGQELQSTLRGMENFLEQVRARPGDLPSLCAGEVQMGRVRGRCSYTPCALSPGGGVVCGGGSSSATLYRVRLEAGNRVLETLVCAP
ncbi:MAG: type IV pilus modification PilV family protein [Thermus aquaticus]|uniref:type IV pilus modification PilV family protein n=1 Tax=Thermus aquaticus TaxID=271 RepID=UPI003C060458